MQFASSNAHKGKSATLILNQRKKILHSRLETHKKIKIKERYNTTNIRWYTACMIRKNRVAYLDPGSKTCKFGSFRTKFSKNFGPIPLPNRNDLM